jgi:hypothetical protein
MDMYGVELQGIGKALVALALSDTPARIATQPVCGENMLLELTFMGAA